MVKIGVIGPRPVLSLNQSSSRPGLTFYIHLIIITVEQMSDKGWKNKGMCWWVNTANTVTLSMYLSHCITAVHWTSEAVKWYNCCQTPLWNQTCRTQESGTLTSLCIQMCFGLLCGNASRGRYKRRVKMVSWSKTNLYLSRPVSLPFLLAASYTMREKNRLRDSKYSCEIASSLSFCSFLLP